MEEKSPIKVFRDVKPTSYGRMDLFVKVENAGANLANYSIAKAFVNDEKKKENDEMLRVRELEAE